MPLFGGLPETALGRGDGAFVLERLHGFIDLFTVQAAEFGNFASVERLAGFAHSVEHLFFGFHRCMYLELNKSRGGEVHSANEVMAFAGLVEELFALLGCEVAVKVENGRELGVIDL